MDKFKLQNTINALLFSRDMLISGRVTKDGMSVDEAIKAVNIKQHQRWQELIDEVAAYLPEFDLDTPDNHNL